MDTNLKQKWVEALRSGHFKQATGNLKTDDCYCCLGVLCTVLGASWNEDEDFGIFLPAIGDEVLYDESDEGVLGDKTLDTVGITREQQFKLTAMNDGFEPATHAHNFDEIADWIEKNL